MGLIYKYTSKTTNKSYIGKTLSSNFKKRHQKHKKVAKFLGYKSGSFTTKMKQNKLVVNGWKIIEESVETTENIT